MSSFIKTLAKPVCVILGLSIMLLFLIVILPSESKKAAAYTPEGMAFDTALFYPAGSVYDRAGAYDTAGRLEYIRARWTFDLVFPFAYGFFCLTAAAFGMKKGWDSVGSIRFLLLLPCAAVLFDLLENLTVTLVMLDFPAEHTLLAYAAAISSALKWVFVGISMLQAIVLPVYGLAKHRIVRRKLQNAGK